MLRYSRRNVRAPSFLGLGCLTCLLQRCQRLVALLGHGVEPRSELREARLELVDGEIVLLHGQQRGDVWMHEISENG
jgi:hypothetical protein